MNTLKLKHTLAIQEDGVTIKWQITDVIWNDNRRGEGVIQLMQDTIFSLKSNAYPALHYNSIYVRWQDHAIDNRKLEYTYDTPEKAQRMMDFIMEHTVKDYEWVYVSDISEENAKISKEKRILLATMPWKTIHKYVCVDGSGINDFKKWKQYYTARWRYAVPIPKEEKKERTLMMTDSEWEEFQKKNNL